MNLKKWARCLLAVAALALLTPALACAASAVAPNEPIVPALERISWAAIAAGLIVALAAHMALSALGISIGAAAVDPYNREHPIKGVPTMLMVWMFVSGLISLFIGGWVAGRLAGTVPFDSALHGVITWALATVVMFLLATTSLGFVIGGTFRALGQGASAAARAAAAVLPGAANMAKEAVENSAPKFDWKGIKREAKQLLNGAVKDEPKTDENAKKNGESKDQGKKPDKAADKNSGFADEDVGELLTEAYGKVRDGINSGDREALVNMITSKSGVTKEAANKTLEKWEKMYGEAKQKYQQAVADAERVARDTAEVAKDAVTRVAAWTFASLLAGVAVAATGGNLGSTYFRL